MLRLSRRRWVKLRKSRIEHKWSGLAQRSDLTADMLKRQHRAKQKIDPYCRNAILMYSPYN
jgi:hypothetical protein